ncbi:uncharacterized protein BYT42DRAFT_224161 [Radiomyces spectabilis]|uniref:uncharacterized protein n=1 Tax=Radiomyces spectabilis TaxID=64574 RepID=UPI00221E913A|nr:uncharacterized protein BYT42DRAFT_224161 [Radiomyces spectabilis]KAI8388152.1 hypothetical protein BYT42DRAFT_224161 [Radiomyces spectabilis]
MAYQYSSNDVPQIDSSKYQSDSSVNTPPPIYENLDEHQLEKRDMENNAEQRKTWLHNLCCVCCPCLPMWVRCICCFCILCIIGLAIVVGVLAALFKQPQVEFNGITDHPSGLPRLQKNASSMAFTMNLGLKIGVKNPNVESITFENIKAVAFYPTNPEQSVGGGEMQNLLIERNSITNFTFPFQLYYDPQQDPNYAMLNDISSKCGWQGATKSDLTVLYDLIPTVRIAGIPISLTLRHSAHFQCPLKDDQLSSISLPTPRVS